MFGLELALDSVTDFLSFSALSSVNLNQLENVFDDAMIEG